MHLLHVESHPRNRIGTLTFLYPFPRFLTLSLLLATLLLLCSFSNSDFTILECTRHVTKPLTSEDNDCELKKTVPLIPTTFLTSLQNKIGIDVTREFLFELSAISVSLSSSSSPAPKYYAIDSSQTLTLILGREIKTSPASITTSASLAENHFHSQIVSLGSTSPSDRHEISYVKDRKNGILKRSSICEVLLESNEEGRVYSYHKYVGYTQTVEGCLVRGSLISQYLENAKTTKKKLHLDIHEESSFLFLIFTIISSVAAVASLTLKGWEKMSVEADTSTLTITTGTSLYMNKFFLRRSVKFCSLETLAKVVPLKRVVLTPGRRSTTEKIRWQLVAQLSGVGIERMVNGSSSDRRGFMEMDIDFGVPVEDYETCRRAAKAINDVIVAFGGGGADYFGDVEMLGLEGPDHDTTSNSDSEERTKLIGLATSPIRRVNGSHQPNLNDIARSSLCVICMAKRSCVVFKPCRHLRCCGSCAERVDKCPICRKGIVEREFVYV
ncbi:hypothetical protein TrVE_jg1265 [Triparma verrucosa]|uniref:RING-type domain-containing protein n=1 Tax=Triparma verrucosa TaxID=1606542 RepID=A0A9W7BU97_9STRA|nr:hypothetical protein TrVE_jg1265 [Triparma verrucosa]